MPFNLIISFRRCRAFFSARRCRVLFSAHLASLYHLDQLPFPLGMRSTRSGIATSITSSGITICVAITQSGVTTRASFKASAGRVAVGQLNKAGRVEPELNGRRPCASRSIASPFLILGDTRRVRRIGDAECPHALRSSVSRREDRFGG